ncbi:hypothetical protein ACIBJI_05035 [Nocardia sp. NPDC050408]
MATSFPARISTAADHADRPRDSTAVSRLSWRPSVSTINDGGPAEWGATP